MKEISLSNGGATLVDEDLFRFLSIRSWALHKSGYAVCTGRDGKTIWMHRLVANTPEHLETDHINRNKLDNRSENLRHVSASVNCINRVSCRRLPWTERNKESTTFRAVFRHKKKKYSFYGFRNEEEAHEFAKSKRKEMGIL